MNVYSPYYLSPVLGVFAVGHEVAKALLEVAQPEPAAAGRGFLAACGAEALQHCVAALVVYGYDLIYEVYLYAVPVGIGIIVIHLAGKAGQDLSVGHRGRQGKERYKA